MMSKRIVCAFTPAEAEALLKHLSWATTTTNDTALFDVQCKLDLAVDRTPLEWADKTPPRTLLKLQADSIEDLWAKLKALRPDADLQTWLIHEPGEEDAPWPLLEIEEWISNDIANGPGLEMPGRSATFEFYVLSPMPANFGFTEAAARERVTGNWHNLLECLECDGKATMRELHVEKALDLLAFELAEASVLVFQEECLLRLTVSPNELGRLASL